MSEAKGMSGLGALLAGAAAGAAGAAAGGGVAAGGACACASDNAGTITSAMAMRQKFQRVG